MRPQNRFIRGLSVSVLAAGWTAAFGQSAGTIYGTVYDASGAVVAGATATATNMGTNQQRLVTASALGEYVISILAVGNYEVRISKEGFAPFLQRGIVLEANNSVEVNGALQVKAAAEQVTVSTEASMVQATSTTLVQVGDGASRTCRSTAATSSS